jgi:hypothetical protein
MEIRLYREGDEQGIRELFRVVFEKEFPKEEWQWKYRSAPWGASSAVAVEEGQIIGHYGGMLFHFCGGDRTYIGSEICDVMTHPAVRSRSLVRLGAMAKAALYFGDTVPMDFAFGFPSERHARLGTSQLGIAQHRLVRVLSKNVLQDAGKGTGWFYSVHEGWSAITAREIDSLWDEIKKDYRLTIDKTSTYLFWRFRDCPTRTYEVFSFRSRFTRKIQAFAVVISRNSDMEVLDFFYRSSFGLRRLFSVLEQIACSRGAGIVKLFVNPGEQSFRLFGEMGYRDEPSIPYIIKIMKPDIPLTPEFFYENYCYRLGDYDAS